MTLKQIALLSICAAHLFGCLLLVHSAETKRERRYGKTIPMGAAQADVQHIPITMVASLTAEHFFDHLERIRTEHGIEFRKRSKVVQEFPDTISVTIRVSCPPCYLQAGKHHIEIEINEMESMSFQASWERGSETTEISHVSVSRSSKYFAAFYHDWLYELYIPSRNIPLTDALNVSVFAQNGQKLAVFKAAL
jgi:hypothetical protein